MKISYNWLKQYIDPLPNADELAEKIIFGAFEVEEQENVGDDTIFEIKVLPDRAHDCLSHQGMAREIAGLIGSQFIDPTENYIVPESKPTQFHVDIQTEKCHRYSARIIRNITIGSSPEWVVKRLESIGQKSINNIVDATNLVMFDCGQPTHAFDAKKLASEKIIVTTVSEPMLVTTLSSEEKELQAGEIVITDEKNILAIAGVKGGNQAEVDTTTTDIIIEVANFDAVSVRKTARRLNILTDSAKRFENELTPELASYAMRELSALIAEMCPDAVFEDIVDVYPEPATQKHVQFSTEYISQKLGALITANDIENILNQYHYEFALDGDQFTVAVPFARIDIAGPHDMVEEIGRVYGYEKITPKIPNLAQKPLIHSEYAKILAIKNDLLKKGYHEVMNYSFRKKGNYEVARGPVGKSALRKNLIDGLTESYEMNRLNKDFLEIDEMKVFEIGTVFEKEGEIFHVAFVDKKQSKESTLDEYISENNIVVPNDHYIIPDSVISTSFVSWSEYPCISRDIAIWVPEGIQEGQVQEIIKQNAGEFLVKGPRLFDTFNKDGKTSFAFRLVFQSPEKTLTEEEVSDPMETITAELIKNGWEVR